MSVIVAAILKKGNYAVCSDGIAVSNDRVAMTNACKIIQGKDYLLGLSGDYADLALLKRALDGIDCTGDFFDITVELHKFMKSLDMNFDGAAIGFLGNRLVTIDGNFGIGEHPIGYAAAGCGERFALGYMDACLDMSVKHRTGAFPCEEHLRWAVSSAKQRALYCGGDTFYTEIPPYTSK